MKGITALVAIIVALSLATGLASVALAADETLPHTGRVLISTDGDVTVPADEQADLVIAINGDATIAGTANTVIVIGGRAILDGATVESLVIADGSADLGGGASILGNVHTFNAQVNRGSATIVGEVRDMARDLAGLGLFIGIAAILLWIGFGIATLLAGVMLVALATRQLRTTTRIIGHEPGRTAVAGLLALVIPPLVAGLAMATVVGIPAGLGLLIVVWPLLAFIGYLVGAVWLGSWLTGRTRAGADDGGRPYGATVIGLLVAFVVGLIPLVTAVISFFGLGAVVLAAWRTVRGSSSRQVTPRMEAAITPA